MRFKEWLLELYGTSASGEVGGFAPVGPNGDDLQYNKKVGSLRTQSDYKPKKRFNGGSGSDGLPPDSTSGYASGRSPKRVAAGLL
jgi:hypothetical protein